MKDAAAGITSAQVESNGRPSIYLVEFNLCFVKGYSNSIPHAII